MIYILIFGMILLALLGLPVAMAMGLSSLAALLYSGSFFTCATIALKSHAGLQSIILVAIPLFILSAKIMNASRITAKIFKFAETLVGFLPGGLAHSNVLLSLIFAGMSGSAAADAAGIGQIEIDAMTKSGYTKKFSVGITAASSTIGPIFPPSIPFVVFSLVSGTSIGRMFLGGVVPGVLMSVSLMIFIAFLAKKYNMPRQPFPTLSVVFRSIIDVFLPLLTPVILLGGIWLGFFTPTESAGVAALYALILGIFVIRTISLKEIIQIFIETSQETAKIGFIVGLSTLYGWVLMRSGMTIKISEKLISISQDPLVILFIISISLLVIGCFLSPIVTIMIMGPIFCPVIIKVGIDPVHFGVVMVLTLMIGLLTPPVGIVLYIMSEVADMKFGEVVNSVWPFLLPLIIVLVLIIIFPGFVTVLPNLVMGLTK